MRAPRPKRPGWPITLLQAFAITIGIILVLPFAIYELYKYGQVRDWK